MTETILVVVEALGYIVLDTGDPQQALRIVRAHLSRFTYS
jgi:hypothetical protein